MLGINPFDEPNVQESKDNTNRVLKEFEATGRLDAAFVSDSSVTVVIGGADAAQPSLIGVLEELFEAVVAGDYLAVTAYVQPTERSQQAFDDIRKAVRDSRAVATTLGYGPRFLHSTGQLHKGGPPRGTFLQVTDSSSPDVAIPGKAFTFGQFKRAQGIGDFESLVSHVRPVVRVHLGTYIDAGLNQLVDAVRAAAAASKVAGR